MKKNKIKATKKELFYNDFSDKWESEINDWETQKRLKVIFGNLLNKKDLKNKRFLEVGCGMGYFSEMAQNNGAKVTGIDIGSNLVKMTKKRVPKGKFLVASASKLPFKDDSFDVLLTTEVIEHVDDQEKMLSEIFRVLKKGGLLVLTTPNKIYKPLFDFLELLGIRPYHGNEKWYFSWDLKRRLEKYGKIIRESNFNLYVNQGYRLRKK